MHISDSTQCSYPIDFLAKLRYFLRLIVARSHRGCPLRSDSSGHVTDLLARWNQGEAAAREELVPLVYEELR